jgi:hypothetical protein
VLARSGSDRFGVERHIRALQFNHRIKSLSGADSLEFAGVHATGRAGVRTSVNWLNEANCNPKLQPAEGDDLLLQAGTLTSEQCG